MPNNILMNKKVTNIINNIQSEKIDIKENEYRVFNLYDDDLKSFDIEITQDSNSYLVINIAGYIHEDINIKIKGIMKGNNSKCVIKFRGVAIKGHGNVEASVNAPYGTKDNVIIEDLKGLLEGGTLSLIPILEIDTSEIEASHYATVGVINEDELFYLQTKGISEEKAIDILKRSFITSPFDKDFITLLRKEENE